MELCGHVHQKECARMFVVALCMVVLNWKLKCPLAADWPSKILNTQRSEICTVMKMNKLCSVDVSLKHSVEPKNS